MICMQLYAAIFYVILQPPQPQPLMLVASGGDRAERARELGPRAQKVKERIIHLPGLNGDIRFNEKGFFRCHCYDHGTACRRQRQATSGRHGAGRPIGHLVAWLRQAREHRDQSDHVAAYAPSKEERMSARTWFVSLAGSQEFLDLERPKQGGEGDEPAYVP